MIHRPARRAAPWALPLTVLALVGAPDLSAQGDPAPDPSADLARALEGAQRAHLRRVGAWGGASLATGLALLAASRGDGQDARKGFGVQTAAWGGINLAIAAWGLSALTAPESGLAGVLRAEDGYNHLLLVNLGLNVGYVAVGTALLVAANHGLRGRDAVRGHGAGVVVQGLGLLVLDGIAWAGSRARLDALHDLVGSVGAGPVPGALSFTLASIPLG